MNKINIYGAGISGMTVAIYLKEKKSQIRHYFIWS